MKDHRSYNDMDRICEFYADFGNKHGDVYLPGASISGEIQIIPNQNFEAEYFGYHLILESRAKYGNSKKILFTKYLFRDREFLQYKRYYFNIDFNHEGIETFKGRNVRFITRLEFFFKTKEMKDEGKVGGGVEGGGGGGGRRPGSRSRFE